MSFTKAAHELFVTPAAISQQVRGLEEELGHALFERRPRKLTLTDAGRRLLPSVTDSFARLAAATGSLDGAPMRGRLRVSVLPSFAHSWLVHRLGEFADRYPEIEVIVQSEPHRADLRAGEADVAVRYGNYASGSGLHFEHLMNETVFIVASPTLMNGPKPLRHPQDLLRHRLLHDSDVRHPQETWLGWPAWFAYWHLTGEPEIAGIGFSDTRLVTRAASAGQGIAIGRSVLVARYLEQGILVRPFDAEMPAGSSYFIACYEPRREDPKIAAFANWLHEAAAG
jgi:LysR family transcriptional regulator, glycine cleavage system transcriptional activator